MRRSAGMPARWRAAGLLWAHLPQWPGRARVVRRVTGDAVPALAPEVRFGPDLVFTADLAVSANLWFFQYAEPSLAPVLDAVLAPGMTFVDVGANVGAYACWAGRRVGPTGTVLAFEPVASTRQALISNIERNGLSEIITVHPQAIGAVSGRQAIFSRPDAHGLSSFASFEGSSSEEVEVVALSDVLKGPVHLIKIDVEGYEAQVVAGLSAVLARPVPPVLVVEIIAEHLARLGSTPDDVLEPLRQAGYACYSLTPRGLRERPAGAAGWLSANVLALRPTEHAAALQRLSSYRFSRDQFD
jgi:FkbM family methyltransferase